MTDSNYTHLLVVVDRSGSMASIQKDMVGGLDNFFTDQAAEDGKCLVDYVQFDNQYELVFEDKPVADAKAVLEPRSMTALVDAIGRSVTDLGEKLKAKSEGQRPGKVIVMVVTDGLENASREWKANDVKALVKKQEETYDWTFTFLGANMDAVAVGAAYGFSKGNSLTYDVNNSDVTLSNLSNFTTRTRSGLRGAAAGYTDSERAASVGNNS